ncbi:hypothetical protein F0344_34390 (plasmid) [Streptomyces finlayi]|uniref:Transposase n=1 Tax=Streptomyces finlayi TaxID=67296 RepID=A0A7G7BW52_9ACTN|nr:hypothetical protein [Streptomyces finlayi]QNE79567.1 hypothetical protein F0344_34390 [Streptomyces finlayi]
MTSTKPAGSDPAPRPKRRSFSPEYKLRIVAEYDGAPRNEKGAVLRRERLYHSHVKEWRAARDAGALENLVDRRTGPARVKKSATEVENEKAAAAGGAAAEGPGPEQGRTRGDGKSFRALGNDLRERGLNPAAGPVVDEAFTGVEAQLGITAACRLTGRSRATHYRRLRPVPPRRARVPQVQPSALTAEERAAVVELMNSEGVRRACARADLGA